MDFCFLNKYRDIASYQEIAETLKGNVVKVSDAIAVCFLK